MTEQKKILLLGSTSFAAKGLPELLQNEGYDITCFKRGAVGREGNLVSGPVKELSANPHLQNKYDTVINYIIIKDGDIEANIKYIRSVLDFCIQNEVQHLIHISSISVYSSSDSLITEKTKIESNPQKKGSYGSLKVATDLYLMANKPNTLKITYCRPGFILGSGMVSPIIGMGFRLGKNILFQMGNGKNIVPITTRDIVNKAIVKSISHESFTTDRVLLVTDKNSPSRREWLEACCYLAGAGRKVVSIPLFIWWVAGYCGELFAKIVGMKLSPLNIIKNACRASRHDSSQSEKALNMSFACNWKEELSLALECQKFDFNRLSDKTGDLSQSKQISVIGYGGIVKQRHIPAIKELNFKGQLMAYDMHERIDENQQIQLIDAFSTNNNDCIIIASPGLVHNQSIPLIKDAKCSVLVEKPLCYTKSEYQEWLQLSEETKLPVYVCHNYRFKSNMVQMYEHIKKYNPGKLHHVHLEFQSPPVSMDSAAWRKNERKARTLLMDYALHFVDIACMFSDKNWVVADSSFELNKNGETSLITALLKSDDYKVTMLLRQGFQPRKCRLNFTFQNYELSLGFFPDTFVPHMADDSAGLYKLEAKASSKATMQKIKDKITNKNSDYSHREVIRAVVLNDSVAKSISVKNLKSFYNCIFDLGDSVYL